MPGGAGQAGAGVLIERVVVLLFESLSGVGGGGANGFRQLPVVDGAAVPGNAGLWWEGVAGLRHLPLEPGEKRDTVSPGAPMGSASTTCPHLGWDGHQPGLHLAGCWVPQAKGWRSALHKARTLWDAWVSVGKDREKKKSML